MAFDHNIPSTFNPNTVTAKTPEKAVRKRFPTAKVENKMGFFSNLSVTITNEIKAAGNDLKRTGQRSSGFKILILDLKIGKSKAKTKVTEENNPA